MAVSEQTPYIEYTANGITTSFALEFDCGNQDHLIVLVDDVEPAVGSWSLTGGAVVFGTAPEDGKKITIQRNTPFSRNTDYQSYNNSFRPQSVNGDFDRVWLKLQELGVTDWLLRLYIDRLHSEQKTYIDQKDTQLQNNINSLSTHVDQQDAQLQQNIDKLKTYVDDKDDELRAYLMEEIRKQGVALDQLDDYYNYLMQRLAQIAVQGGWEASFVVDGDKTQKQINDLAKVGKVNLWLNGKSYLIGDIVKLDDGTEVVSTVNNNTNNPNLNMIGWEFLPVHITNIESVGFKGGPSEDATAFINKMFNISGFDVIQLKNRTYTTDGFTIPPNTVVFMNGAKFKRLRYSGKPVVKVGENSIIVSPVVDGNKDVLGVGGAIADSGIQLESNARVIFGTSINNRSHGITMRGNSTLVTSENQQALFCTSSNNGFNPGANGTADGFNALNCNNGRFIGCTGLNNARSNFVSETYNGNLPGEQKHDLTFSNNVSFESCVGSGAGYNEFNAEMCTSPNFSDIKASGMVTFRGSLRATLSKVKAAIIYGQDADYPQVSDILIENNASSSGLLYLLGKAPKVSNVRVVVGDSVALTGTTVEIQDTVNFLGEVFNVSVNRAFNGMTLRVANAQGLRVDSAANVKFFISRQNGASNVTSFKSLSDGKLECFMSAVPTAGAWTKNDIVWNTFFSATSKTMAWICTSSGVFGGTPPVFEAVSIMSNASNVAQNSVNLPGSATLADVIAAVNTLATNDNTVKTALKNAGIMRSS